ncbi:acyl-CoA dehydrogenase family protein [Pseudoroseomonas wenyumeiae]
MEEDRAESIRMIRDSAAGIAPRGGDRRRIRELRFREPGYDPAMLRQMGEQGWIGLRVPEALGGAGLGLRELCALTEELGAALVPEPLIPAALSAVLLTAAEAEEPLQQMLSGKTLLLTAWQEAPATLEAPGHAGAPRLFIPAAGGAAGFLVPVAQDGRMALRLQEGGAAPTLERTQDGGFLGTLQPGEGRVIAADIGPALQDALDEATLATAAYLLGVMDQAFALTLDYLRTRQQFGRPIGSFQALQHRAADLKIQVALTRASIDSAAALMDRGMHHPPPGAPPCPVPRPGPPMPPCW